MSLALADVHCVDCGATAATMWAPMNSRRAERAANVVVHAGFVLAGIVTTLLGPILPILIARWSLSDERAGLFFVCQFGTSMIGVVSLGALIPRWGYKVTVAA